jgi:hypothetical protein
MNKKSSRTPRARSLDHALIEAQRQADFWRERVEVLLKAKRVIDEDLATIINRPSGEPRNFVPYRARVKREHPKKNQIDPTSNIGHSVAILRDAGVPLHIRKIIEGVEARTGKRINQHGLVGSISQYVREGRIFFRPEPNTFGLMEWRTGNPAR